MKLCEIKTVDPKGVFVSPKSDMLGSGIQGVAYKHPKQPNSVIKTAEIENPDTDSYAEFIRLAMAHQDNPFFPRIHSAKIIKSPEPKPNRPPNDSPYTLVVNMEKLQPYLLSNVTDAAHEMFQRLGVPEKVAQSDNPGALFNYLLSTSNRRELANKTPNPQFREALLALEPFIQEFDIDMHGGNWMVRLTGHGPQIVILDPLHPS